MADDILNQDEINALLEATPDVVDDSLMQVEDSPDEAEETVQPYVIQPPDHLSTRQLRRLSALHEDFIRELQPSLSLFLRTRIDLNLLSVEQKSYAEYASSTAALTHLNVFDVSPPAGRGLLELTTPVLFGILGHQLGGADSGDLPDRVLTAVETAIIEPILKLLFEHLKTALSGDRPLEVTRLTTETTPADADITGPWSPVAVVCLDAEVGETTRGLINICYPAPLVAELLREPPGETAATPAPKDDTDNAEYRRLILASLMDVPVRLPVVLGEIRLTTEEWLGIEPGDVLLLPRRIHDPVRVDVEGYPLYHGRPGRVGDHLCVRLLHPADHREEPDINSLIG